MVILDTDSHDVTAVILAGGMSRRLGRNKAVEPFGGEPLIHRVIRRMGAVAHRVAVVCNDDERVRELDLPAEVSACIDLFPDSGPLGGIFTALISADTEWVAVCGCDMPFVSPEVFGMLLSRRVGFDVVVPIVDGRPETIHAIYSRACIEPIRAKLLSGDLKISRVFDELAVSYVAEEEIRQLDLELSCFLNVNTEADLKLATSLASSEVSR